MQAIKMSVDSQQAWSPGGEGLPLRLGYVPMSDCAPIAVAQEMGLFERYDLQVELSREEDWESIRHKIYLNQLDASQSLAGIAFALGMGFPELRCDVAVPMMLNAQRANLTLSRRLDPERIGCGDGLRQWLDQHPQSPPLTFATTHRFSSHHILLRQWLEKHEVNPDREARIIQLAPHRMPEQLQSGELDGFCVGQPWNSKAILNGDGWCPSSSFCLSNGHPEKVLLVAGRLLRKRRPEAVRLVAALLESSRLCEDPEFHETLVQILSQPGYTDTPADVLRHDMEEWQIVGRRAREWQPDVPATRPTVEKAAWVLAGLTSMAAMPIQLTAGSLSRIYREDLYHEALKLSHM